MMHREPGDWPPLFRADWTRFLFVHYGLPAADLAPHTPFAPECRGGRAFASLVFFRFERMRPAFVPSGLGRLMLRPASDHWFLNVRTYVRGPAGPGIQFMVEWMDNRIGHMLGPLTYGLPYRRGQFVLESPLSEDVHLSLKDPEFPERLQIGWKPATEEPREVEGALERLLLEQYTAYTWRRGRGRCFRIAHPHWQVARPTGLVIDDSLVRRCCPWFVRAERLGAHESRGFRDVAMGFPRPAAVERDRAPGRHGTLQGEGLTR